MNHRLSRDPKKYKTDERTNCLPEAELRKVVTHILNKKYKVIKSTTGSVFVCRAIELPDSSCYLVYEYYHTVRNSGKPNERGWGRDIRDGLIFLVWDINNPPPGFVSFAEEVKAIDGGST